MTKFPVPINLARKQFIGTPFGKFPCIAPKRQPFTTSEYVDSFSENNRDETLSKRHGPKRVFLFH